MDTSYLSQKEASMLFVMPWIYEYIKRANALDSFMRIVTTIDFIDQVRYFFKTGIKFLKIGRGLKSGL